MINNNIMCDIFILKCREFTMLCDLYVVLAQSLILICASFSLKIIIIERKGVPGVQELLCVDRRATAALE